MNFLSIVVLSLFFASSIVHAAAQRETQDETPVSQSPQEVENRLTKNWGGPRKTLSARGIDLAAIYKGNVVANLDGGKRTGSNYLGNLDLRASFDGEKIANWKGTTAFLYFLIDHGGKPTGKFVGDAQGVSNVETSAIYTAKIYEGWVQHLFHEDRISILAGLHDLNSEFYVTDAASVFFNGSFGVGPELSQTGVNHPSIFPVTSPAIRLRVEPSKSFYLQWGAWEARAGDPSNPRGTHVRVRGDDGMLTISEFAYLRGIEGSKERAGKYAFGAWGYTSTFDHLTDVTSDSQPVRATSAGAYVLAEQTVRDGVALFLRYGLATTTVNRFGTGTQAGVLFTGLFPHRASDRLGLAATRAANGREYKDAQKAAGIAVADAEETIELTYRMELLPGIALQPDFQYVMHPNTDPSLRAASVGTMRIELTL